MPAKVKRTLEDYKEEVQALGTVPAGRRGWGGGKQICLCWEMNSPVFRGDDDRDTRSCQLCFFPRELLFRVSWRKEQRRLVSARESGSWHKEAHHFSSYTGLSLSHTHTPSELLSVCMWERGLFRGIPSLPPSVALHLQPPRSRHRNRRREKLRWCSRLQEIDEA